MIVFAIPLRAKETTNNWEKCLENFNATIESIFNQTEPEFHCIVACNEIPKLNKIYDERLEFIKVDTPIPSKWIEMARDKFWKLTVIAARIRKLLEESKEPQKGIYVMPVDADDLLNCHIAEWCKRNPDCNGAVSKIGYVWKKGQFYVRKYKDMHTYCGSCNIIKMYLEDLPESIPFSSESCLDKETAKILNERYPIRYDHNIVVDKYKELGRPFEILLFPSTIYVLGTGDNISSIFHNKNTVKRFHPIALLRNINIFKIKLIDKKIKKEFGIE